MDNVNFRTHYNCYKRGCKGIADNNIVVPPSNYVDHNMTVGRRVILFYYKTILHVFT